MDTNLQRSLKVICHWPRLIALSKDKTCDPITIEIDPTNRCNHRCVFCSSYNHNGISLSRNVLANLLREIKEFGEILSISWKGGGEPTLYPYFLEMTELAENLELKQGLTTNGSKLRENEIKAASFKMSWVRVSLDAATAKTHERIHRSYDFDKIVDGIIKLGSRPKSCRLGINMTISPENIDEVKDFVSLGQDLGVDYVALRPAYYEPFGLAAPEPNYLAQLRDTLEMLKGLSLGNLDIIIGQVANAGRIGSYIPKDCLAPALRPVVGADGEVYACCDLRGHREYSFGNVYLDSFRQIWESEKRKEVFGRTRKLECLKYCSKAYDYYNRVLDILCAQEDWPDKEFM